MCSQGQLDSMQMTREKGWSTAGVHKDVKVLREEGKSTWHK